MVETEVSNQNFEDEGTAPESLKLIDPVMKSWNKFFMGVETSS